MADPFFTEQSDATGKCGIDPLLKVIMALKQVAYGCSPSAFLDYLQMGESTARACLKNFAKIVATDKVLQTIFARKMTRVDARRISAMHEAEHGVPGMIGSLDCTHVFWKNCPVAWQGSQTGKEGKPTITLEACVDYNLWFWHASFGWPGSLNDINIWNRSSLLKRFLDGSFAEDVDFEFEIGGRSFGRLWLLVDGIYPEISRFVKTIEEPPNHRAFSFSSWQEGARKDVERGFGVLKRKFQILHRPFELWHVRDISNVVSTCLILHNMMVAHRIENDDVESESLYIYDERFSGGGEGLTEGLTEGPTTLEAEQQVVNRRTAEMEHHRQLLQGLDSVSAAASIMTPQQKAIVDSLCFQYAQERWNGLYNLEEHHRLRGAIIDHLQQ